MDLWFEERGHVISEGSDDEVREFFEEELVHEVVEADVKASAAKDAASTHSSSAEGDMEDSVALFIFVDIHTGQTETTP